MGRPGPHAEHRRILSLARSDHQQGHAARQAVLKQSLLETPRKDCMLPPPDLRTLASAPARTRCWRRWRCCCRSSALPSRKRRDRRGDPLPSSPKSLVVQPRRCCRLSALPSQRAAEEQPLPSKPDWLGSHIHIGSTQRFVALLLAQGELHALQADQHMGSKELCGRLEVRHEVPCKAVRHIPIFP